MYTEMNYNSSYRAPYATTSRDRAARKTQIQAAVASQQNQQLQQLLQNPTPDDAAIMIELFGNMNMGQGYMGQGQMNMGQMNNMDMEQKGKNMSMGGKSRRRRRSLKRKTTKRRR